MSSARRLSSSTTTMRALSICRTLSQRPVVRPAEPPRSFFHDLAGRLDWNAHAHGRAFALPADDVDLSVEHGCSFPHAEQPKGPGARKLAPGHAAPIVLYFEDEFVAF